MQSVRYPNALFQSVVTKISFTAALSQSNQFVSHQREDVESLVILPKSKWEY